MEHMQENHISYLEKRKIDPETAMRLGVYSSKTHTDGGGVLVFPFKLEGETVNRKYRTIDEKKFWQDANATRCFWNAEVFEDPEITRLVITEGELDAICAIQAGHPHTVSVPDGAVSENAEQASGKLAFMADCPALWQIPEIVIATDNDGPGKALAKELVRRLGAARCFFVEWPERCKDFNEVLYRHGASRITEMIENAKPYPVKGLFKLSDYPDIASPTTHSTGWDRLDQWFKPVMGTFIVITGVPNAGKSKWTAALLKNLINRYGHKAAMASFEMPVTPYLRNDLRKHLAGNYPSLEAKQKADQWIEENLVFIDQDFDGEDEDVSIDWVIDRARDAVVRYGINWLLIDPWNQIDDLRKPGESLPDYQRRALKSLKRFAKNHEVGVIVVAHPTKDVKTPSGEIREPTLYDIEGSAHWANSADHGIVLDRDLTSTQIKIAVKKARYHGTGKSGGEVWLNWIESEGRYHEVSEPIQEKAE